MTHLTDLHIAFLNLRLAFVYGLTGILIWQKALEEGKKKCQEALDEIRRINGY